MPRTRRATESLTTTLTRAYQRLGLGGRSVLLAVSGGADSTALLVGTALVAPALRLRVEVASLDHGLRPESAGEVESVARLAARFALPFHTRALRLRGGAGLEARAREARYAALESLRAEGGLDAVATAHTASDQAETLLMRLARGTSLKGARGIQAQRGTLVRPLLEHTREEVEAFLAEQDVPFLVDPMNADGALLRTRIRRDALPALSAAMGYPVAPRLAAFARLAAEDGALLESLAEAAWRRLALPDGGLDAVGVRALEAPLQRRVLARLVEEAGAGVDEALLERLLQAVRTGRPATLGRGLQLRAAGGRVRCVRPGAASPPPPVELEGPGASATQEGSRWDFSVRARPAPPGVLWLALPEAPRWPLTVRTRRPGDRVPLGGKSRRLQDVLVDLRVAAEGRDLLPVVVDAAGALLWVPGVWAPAPRSAPTGHYLWAAPPAASNPRGPPL
ncbi:tRNA lysidine(34) synthetase TilS [Myxococcaceae bacterium GXIMD 01537]